MKSGRREKAKLNKSSIVRVIISNFDDKQVKEIKVLYTKQGGIDVIKFKSTEKDEKGRMKFNFDCAYNRLEEEEFNSFGGKGKQSFFVTTNEDLTELHVTKRHKTTGEIIKDYTIQGKYTPIKQDRTKVTVSITDNKDHFDSNDLGDKIRLSRSLTQYTNRILLDADVMKNYREIVCSDSEKVDETINIDSQEIYKINRFLSYRSNMIIYYQMINNFLLHYDGEEDKGGNDSINLINEIWKYENKKNDEKEKIIERSYKSIEKSINQYILNHNTEVESGDKEKKIDISEERIKEDLKKTFILFSRLRHYMVHYNYKFYENLYSGKNFIIYNKDKSKSRRFSELLDLNIFKELSKIKLVKNRAVSNYLDKKTTIHVLNKNINAIKLLDIYRDICETKNGFNNFINNMMTISGEEDKEYKEMVTKHFNENMNKLSIYLENFKKHSDFKTNNKKKETYNLLKQELDEQKKLRLWFNAPYVYDIHSSKKYKELYVERKKYVDIHSKLIEAGINNDNKKKLNEINVKLCELNTEMKEMTKLNSKYRLQYKLQLAFGFILEEFNLDIDKFVSAFDKDNNLTISKFMEKRETYLSKSLDRRDNRFKKLIKDYKFRDTEDIFCSDRENNLVKLYILMYILLPVEIRGDFLGFVKKNYYDLKHVDFIDKRNNDNKDTFFHDLRLFEKNVKRLEVTSYSLSDGFLGKKSREKFGKELEKFIYKNVSIALPTNIDIKEFNKSLVLPMMKNYQIIFKLLNDIEISALFLIAKKEGNEGSITFKKVIDKVRKEDMNGNINFSQVMKMALNEKVNCQIRNSIAHINMKQLYIEPLNIYINNNQNKKTISEQMEEIIDICITKGLTGKELNKNIINDYYMKKEKLVFNLKLRKRNNLVSIDAQQKNMKEKSILNKYDLNYKDENLNIKEIILKVNDLNNKQKLLKETTEGESNYKNALSKDILLLNGIIRKNINFKIKEMILGIIQQNEYRYVNINIYDKIRKEDHNIDLKINNKYIEISCYENKSNESTDERINFKIKYMDLKVKNELLVPSCYEDIYIKKKIDLEIRYIENCKVVYIDIYYKKYNINLEFDGKTLFVKFNKDVKKNNQKVNLESNYIQNIKFIVS